MKQFERTINLINLEQFNKIKGKKIIVFGIGGVGSPCVESLVRTGIGNIIIVDKDIVDITNLNRQVFTNHTNIGLKKVDALKSHLLEINPNLNITTYDLLIDDNSINQIDFSNVDYIIDCVDDVNAKIAIIKKSKELMIPIISSMGTGNKLDPTKFLIKDISKTEMCPLAKKVRLKLRELNIKNVPVLFSTEVPRETSSSSISSIIFVTSTAGLLIANYVFQDLLKNN